MAETAAFTTGKRNSNVIEFSIDKDDYHFTPPKSASMVLPIVETMGDTDVAALKAQFDWLGEGLPDEENERLISRLKDPEDDFDMSNLENILEWVMKQVNGRPTG